MASQNCVFGKNSVKVLLETDPKRIFKIFVSDSLKPDKRIDQIYQLAREKGIQIQTAPRQKLDNMLREHQQGLQAGKPDKEDPHYAGDISHQGIIAQVAPKPLLSFQELLTRCRQKIQSENPEERFPIILVLDGITDPRNFGAILRIADGAGVEAVIIPKHNSAGFTLATSKTASGADQTMDVVMIGSLTHAIDSLKEIGFWIVGTQNTPEATHYYQLDYKMPTALIMGSEGTGIRPVIQKSCDFLVKIPMAGIVSSLNVAVATGILVFEIVKAHQLLSAKAAK